MQFIVPKFIEREARIAGPLTFKQLIIFIITAAIIFLLYRLFPRTIFFIFSALLVLISVSLVFLKVNGRPLLSVFGHFSKFLFLPRIFIWKKGGKSTSLKKIEIKKEKKKLPLNIIKSNQLKRLKTKIETKVK